MWLNRAKKYCTHYGEILYLCANMPEANINVTGLECKLKFYEVWLKRFLKEFSCWNEVVF